MAEGEGGGSGAVPDWRSRAVAISRLLLPAATGRKDLASRAVRQDSLRQPAFGGAPGAVRAHPQGVVALVAFRAHYGFEAFYCLPGKDGAHEKGGVEGDGGRFRRTHLVPVPDVETLAELNARLAAADAAEDDRHIDGRTETVGEAFAVEEPLLLGLPAERFDTALALTARVDRYAQIMVRQCQSRCPRG
jgi:hypothetical protein